MKVVIRLILPCILIALLMACGSGKSSDSIDAGPDRTGLLNEFIIMAYSGPPPGEVTLERFQEIADAGIEFLVPGNGTFNEEQNLKAMDLCAKTGVRVIPIDLRLFPFALTPDIAIDSVAIKEIVDSYKDHPALAAYVIKDEPGGDLFPALRTISDIFRAEDPYHEPLINLFPNYGTIHQFGVADYRTYITSFIETVKPGLLAYDSYPLRNGITIYDDWYSNLEVVREEAKKANIPFLVFIQSEGIKEGLRVPNRAEILWQVNTVLAYGAQGIGWFCYWTPLPDQGFQREDGAQAPLVESHYNAMIDIKGNRTEVYDHVREANLYLKKAGRGLLEWDNTDVARYEAGKMLEGGSSPVVTPAGEDANIVIGTFKKESGLRIVISNSSCEKPAVFSLQLSSGWKMDEIFTSIDANPVGEKKSLLEWNIKPGGSVLIDLKPALVEHN